MLLSETVKNKNIMEKFIEKVKGWLSSHKKERDIMALFFGFLLIICAGCAFDAHCAFNNIIGALTLVEGICIGGLACYDYYKIR
jgi:hypothetical protein